MRLSCWTSASRRTKLPSDHALLLETSLGTLLLKGSQHQLHAVLWPGQYRADSVVIKSAPVLHQAGEQIHQYLAGERRDFEISLAPAGTPFQSWVWQQLSALPYGRATSYQKLAEQKNPHSSARAVGGAVGRNPIAIVVPCHRVLGSDGGLTGFAGGVERKRRLLDLEGIDYR